MEINKVNDLSFYNDQGILTISAKQYDTGRKFSFNIIADDEPFNLSECTAYLRILKPDGKQFEGEECCFISGNIITIDTSIGNGEQILVCEGINKCEIHLIDKNGKGLTTWTFHIDVIPRVHNGEHIDSIDSWDSWDKMKDDIYDIRINFDKKANIDSPTLTGIPNAPTASAGTNTTQIATTAFVQKAISDGIAASDALIFKGTIGCECDESGNIINEGTVIELPTIYKTGWTYRVITNGIYAGQTCEIGDLIIALNDRDEPIFETDSLEAIDMSHSITINSDWCVAQTNIDGAITEVKSGDAYIGYEQSGSIVTIVHKDVKRTDSISSVKPLHGGSFTAVKSVTSDEKGHVTEVETETITLPNIDEKVNKSGDTMSGNFTVYADGENTDPDLKVRDKRVDILKTDGGQSAAVFKKQSDGSDYIDFKADKMQIGNNSGEKVFDYDYKSKSIQIGAKASVDSMKVYAKDFLRMYCDNIILTTLAKDEISIGVASSLFLNVDTVAQIKTDDFSGNEGVLRLDTDKAIIGTKPSNLSNITNGIFIEENNGKFVFIRKGKEIKFDDIVTAEKLSNNFARWINTYNNEDYYFVQDGAKWTSNNKGVHKSTASSTWTIDLPFKCEYTFKYRVSSEPDYDKLTITLDGATIANGISGKGAELSYTATLDIGTHTIVATYAKDNSVDDYDDCGYLILDPAVHYKIYAKTAETADSAFYANNSGDADTLGGYDADDFYKTSDGKVVAVQSTAPSTDKVWMW